jgi:hypothetical protein
VENQRVRSPRSVYFRFVLESSSTGTSRTLEDFITAFPNACIANAFANDPGLPRNLPTAGVLLSLGNADHDQESELEIKSWLIDIDLYDVWSSQ